jgi:hypothetical protein
MNIADFFNLINWSPFLLIFGIVIGIAILLFRRCSYFIYDPAWIVVGGLSIAVTLMLYVYVVEQVRVGMLVGYVCAAFLTFLIGARGTCAILQRNAHRAHKIDFGAYRSRLQRRRLLQILFVLQVLIVLLISVRAATQGLPILADDPESAKVDVNAGAGGYLAAVPIFILANETRKAWHTYVRAITNAPRALISIPGLKAIVITLLLGPKLYPISRFRANRRRKI